MIRERKREKRNRCAKCAALCHLLQLSLIGDRADRRLAAARPVQLMFTATALK
jgi:hypothetical protein